MKKVKVAKCKPKKKLTLDDLSSSGDLKVIAQCRGTGKRVYSYLGVESGYLNNAAELKEWLKTFCLEVE